ncbi:hypothetical protein HanPSC8_Chr03g0128961 [Helianthus annuus]|nr:hypothetical protein HanPSC8_Chr03g0128961 [Helianthus annuus]
MNCKNNWDELQNLPSCSMISVCKRVTLEPINPALSVPCERDLQLLEVVLKQDVNLAAATALCRGNSDCTHPSSDGHLLDTLSQTL